MRRRRRCDVGIVRLNNPLALATQRPVIISLVCGLISRIASDQNRPGLRSTDEMHWDDEIEPARTRVLVWLRGKTRSQLEYLVPRELSEAHQKNGQIAYLFFKEAHPRGFIWSLIERPNGYIVRWSHPRVNPGKAAVAQPQATAEDARLLACAALLENRTCLAELERH